MGMIVAPDEHQRHQVTIEISGPVDETKWAKYRAAVKALVKKYKKYGARLIVRGRIRKARAAKKK
jgi:hypothetical protein